MNHSTTTQPTGYWDRASDGEVSLVFNPTFIQFFCNCIFWLRLVHHHLACYRLLHPMTPQFIQSPFTSALSSIGCTMKLCAFNHHYIFWVTLLVSNLWLLCGWVLKGQQMCCWFMLGPWVSTCWDGSMSLKRPKPSSYQQGEFQKQGEQWTPSIPAAIGFIYLGKGVERRGSKLSSAHVRWGSGQQ